MYGSSDDDSAVQVQTAVHQLYSASNMDVDTKVQVVMFAEQNSVHAALRRFPGLAASTVRRWVDMVRKSRQNALRRAPAGAQAIAVSYADALSDARVNNGRVLPEGALTAAFDRFMDAREAGMLVSTELLRQIVLSEVTKVDATIVHSASNPGGWFKCTDMWLRRWRTDNFISRRAVTTARRADVDKEATRTKFLHRVAFVVHKYGIPMELVYHADETGVCLSPTATSTLDFRGEKQVSGAGIGDKRQATVMLGGTIAGEKLTPQVVFEGKTARVLPADEPGWCPVKKFLRTVIFRLC